MSSPAFRAMVNEAADHNLPRVYVKDLLHWDRIFTERHSEPGYQETPTQCGQYGWVLYEYGTYIFEVMAEEKHHAMYRDEASEKSVARCYVWDGKQLIHCKSPQDMYERTMEFRRVRMERIEPRNGYMKALNG